MPLAPLLPWPTAIERPYPWTIAMACVDTPSRQLLRHEIASFQRNLYMEGASGLSGAIYVWDLISNRQCAVSAGRKRRRHRQFGLIAFDGLEVRIAQVVIA